MTPRILILQRIVSKSAKITWLLQFDDWTCCIKISWYYILDSVHGQFTFKLVYIEHFLEKNLEKVLSIKLFQKLFEVKMKITLLLSLFALGKGLSFKILWLLKMHNTFLSNSKVIFQFRFYKNWPNRCLFNI